MKIAVVGGGAMGSLFAGYLAMISEDVWIYDIWQEHVKAINSRGLLMTRNKKDQRVWLKATSIPATPGLVDLILIFVKFGQTHQAVRDACAMIGGETAVLTLQNGVGNVEIIHEVVPPEQILFGLTTLTSELRGPGHIEESFQGRGETYFWPLTGKVDSRAQGVCEVLNQAGIHTKILPDVEVRIWKKLVVNACYNSLSAITHLKVGDLIDQPATWEMLSAMVSEIIQVAQKRGIGLDEKEGHEFLKQVGQEARGHVPSMLVDVNQKRRTEIDCLNGAVVREGERLGVVTPYNRILCNLVRVIEDTYDKRVT
jgi:2-dehydropantoate 2-reductase